VRDIVNSRGFTAASILFTLGIVGRQYSRMHGGAEAAAVQLQRKLRDFARMRRHNP
jgi:hypothetical protein